MSDPTSVCATQNPGRPAPLLLEACSPRERGCAHGEQWRAAIRALADLRLGHLLRSGPQAQAEDWSESVRSQAGAYLDSMAVQTPALHEEVLGIAEGAGLPAAQVVVLNAVEDIAPAGAAESVAGGDTSIYFNASDGPLLGHRWAMHPDVAQFARILGLTELDGRVQWLLTLPGTLGMAGLNPKGLAVSSLGLSLIDRGVGLPWPAVVRRLLGCESAADACDTLKRLPLAGSRYVIVADGEAFFGIESSHGRAITTQVGPKAAHLHTNHCFDPLLRQRERLPRSTSSFRRINETSTVYAQERPKTMDALWAILGGDRVGNRSPGDDDGSHNVRTAALAVMRPGGTQLRWAPSADASVAPTILDTDQPIAMAAAPSKPK